MDTPAGPRKQLHRYDVPNHARGINFSCYRKQPFLRSTQACTWFAEFIRDAAQQHNIDVWAWCFLPTHVHLLLFPRGGNPDVGAFLFSAKKPMADHVVAWVSRHAPTFLPRMTERSGVRRFWQRGGGYDRNLFSPDSVHAMREYIHANPVEAGLCRRPEDWPWSSARQLRTGEPGPIPLNLDKFPSRFRR